MASAEFAQFNRALISIQGRMYTGLKAALVLFVAVVVFSNSATAQRAIVVSESTVQHGEMGCLSVSLRGGGGEFATAFSLAWDPNLLTFAGSERGLAAAGASLFINTNHVSAGFVGILVAQFTAGPFDDLVHLCFRARAGIPDTSTAVWLCDTPIARDTIDLMGTALPASYHEDRKSVV